MQKVPLYLSNFNLPLLIKSHRNLLTSPALMCFDRHGWCLIEDEIRRSHYINGEFKHDKSNKEFVLKHGTIDERIHLRFDLAEKQLSLGNIQLYFERKSTPSIHFMTIYRNSFNRWNQEYFERKGLEKDLKLRDKIEQNLRKELKSFYTAN